MRKLWGVLWFVPRNLFRRGRVSATVVGFLALTILTFLAVVGLGVYFGYRETEKQKLLADPSSLSLWIGSPVDPAQWFDQERLSRLESVLRQLPEVTSWYPCREIALDWFQVGLTGIEASVRLRGRTFSPEDPIIRVIQQSGKASLEEGVAVTPEFLINLGLLEGEGVPSQLGFRNASLQKQVTPVCGTISDQLPWRHSFLVSESWYKNIFFGKPDALCQRFRTGPLPRHWPQKWREYSDDIRRAFSDYKFFPPTFVIGTDGHARWDVTVTEPGGLRLSEIRIRLERICELMDMQLPDRQEEEAFLNGVEILEPEVSGTPEIPPPQFVVIYVRDLQNLKSIKAHLENAGFPVRDPADTIHRLEEMARRSALLGQILTGVMLGLGGGLFAMLISLQVMRTDIRRQEIGILKALGMPRWYAVLMLVAEAGVIWLLGTTAGLAVGYPLGRFVLGPNLLAPEPRLAESSFIVPVGPFGIVAFVVLSVNILTVVGTAWRAIRASPILTVQA